MKRRDFILKSLLFMAGASTLMEQAFAGIVWVKKGIMNYVSVAPPVRMKKNEKCLTCQHFKDDLKVPVGGLCTLKAINKGQVVYVKKEGVCSMYKKKV